MAKSIKQIEAEVLSFLDSIGEDSQAFKEVTGKGIEEAIILSAANFILKVQENLNRAGAIDTGTLSSQITQGDLINTGGKYELDVGYRADSKAAKYYDFVNKGVKGTRSGNPADSPYSFKNDKPGRAMQSALMGWYRRNSSFARREDAPKKSFSQVQRKRKKLLKMVNESSRLKSLAYATAVNIKRRGLKKTGFFDKAVDSSFGQDFYNMIAKISGKEIVINIRNGNNNK